jgi:tetratricopeptide (TPR) repeat protein
MLSLVPFRNSVSEQSPGMGAPGNAGDTIMLKKMFDQADLFAKRGKLDSAIMLFMQTGQMYAAMNMKGHYAACLNKVAEQFIMAGMIDQGKAITLQALQSSIEAKNVKEEGGALLNLGSVYAITSGFDSAIQYFKKAESIWKKEGDLHE